MSRDVAKASLVHFHSDYPNRAYCGTTLTRDTRVSEQRTSTTCPNCNAAIAADEEARS
ncbi:MAG: hypothetical protein JSS74_09110 [Actinobacteria bacterium]|nr:hypothetical protein [Actinomycetota bacterium]